MNKKLTGLTSSQVEESKKKNGNNVIIEAEPPTFKETFMEGFKDPMIQILCAISVLMIGLFLAGLAGIVPKDSVKIYEPLGTIVAILLVNFISAKTSMASDKAYRKLKDSVKKDTVKCYRGGVLQLVEADELVVGDIVLLQSGDKVPADGALVSGELRIDNSALNGETDECKKYAADEGFKIPEEINGETFVDKHSLFRGAVLFNGEGLMEIQKVGMNTMMGKMAEDMSSEEVDSPLKVKLGILANQISKFGYIGAVVISVAYLIHYVLMAGGLNAWLSTGGLAVFQGIMEAVMIAIVIVVCAVPEGLPLMISLVLMQNTGKLLDHNCLVRKPIGIETAGSLNILFSDKTGTITKGKLEVVEVFDGAGNSKKGKEDSITELIQASISKNTDSMFDDKHNVVGGNVTDQALLKFVGEETFNKMSEQYEVAGFQKFNSANKFSQARIKTIGKTVYKGAPEKLLDKAKYYLDENGEEQPIDLGAINKVIDDYASRAMRVLAFGYSPYSLVENQINDDIVIVGFVGIRDDVRPEAKESIKEVKAAGIQVVMITGDKLETAVAIAKEAGLLEGNIDVITSKEEAESLLTEVKSVDTIALTSDVLNKLSDELIKVLTGKIRVIARALPTDKSRMVRLCQELNLVTGMTGDGVNDTPALKRADVGFAMGSGTDAAKEAAELVIIDDNFQSIKDSILYGRTIYHNILKFCKFQLAINVGAVVLSAIAPFIGIEEPLNVIQLLYVNLCMDSLGALSIGAEAARRHYMVEKPRRRDEGIIQKPMFIQFTFVGLYLVVMSIMIAKVPEISSIFGTDTQVKTGIFSIFMITALLNGFNVREEGYNVLHRIKENKNFLPVTIINIVVTMLIATFGGEVFGCEALNVQSWVIVYVIALAIIPLDILRKIITNMVVKIK